MESSIWPPAPGARRQYGLKRSAPHLSNLLLVVHHQQGHTEQDGAELLHSLLKLASCSELVAQLQALDQVIKLQSHSRESILQASFFPGGREGMGIQAGLIQGPARTHLHYTVSSAANISNILTQGHAVFLGH